MVNGNANMLILKFYNMFDVQRSTEYSRAKQRYSHKVLEKHIGAITKVFTLYPQGNRNVCNTF